MSDAFEIVVNGRAVRVTQETSVAVSILNAGFPSTRVSITGEARAPLCGMGICFECVADVNGMGRVRTCQLKCSPGMVVTTDGH